MKNSSEQQDRAAPQRVVAIVGRPNVGKSALFNRLVGRRMAIVHEESGVTRDRVATEAAWGEERFELIDTGGLALMDGEVVEDRIDRGVRDQVEVAIEDAAVVILVTDVSAGQLPLDEEMGRLLHASGRRVLVAANKADHPGLDDRAAEFEGLGFPVFPISVLHKRGIGDLMDAAVAGLPEATTPATTELLRVAVVGRPNVGKSSYINRLLRSDRVIVSDVPGTTRDTVEVPFTVGRGDQARHYVLMDTAGMRRMGKVDTAVERFSLFRAEHTIGHADVVAVVLDAEQGPTAQDKKIARKVIEHRKGCLLLVNKWDLAMEEKITQRRYGAALREAMPHLTFAPVVFMSAKSGYNIRKSIEAMDYVASQVSMEIGTGTLNRVLHDAFKKVGPPTVSGKRLKFYYATQTGAKPLRFALFVNNQKLVAPAYKSYLVNILRSSFGLEGAPLVLQFRDSHDHDRR